MSEPTNHEEAPARQMYALDFDRGELPDVRELPQSFAWRAWDLWVRVADWKAGERIERRRAN